MSLEELMLELKIKFFSDEGVVNELKELVKSGITSKDIDLARYRGDTFLCLASINNYIKTAQFLINFGCDVNLKDDNGWTPLMCACYYNQEKIVEFLLQSGANPNLKSNYGETALMKACYEGCEESVELIA